MKLFDHSDGGTFDDKLADLVGVPFAPEERIEIPFSEPVHSSRHLTLKGEAAHLAVGDDIEAGVLLQANGLVDGPVLDLLEFVGSEFAGVQTRLSLEELGRAEQASDDVCASLQHRITLVAPRYDLALAPRRGRL